MLEITAIAPHVHLRDFDEAHKEDLNTGTAAAVAGGFTTVLDMPNNTPPITDGDALDRKLARAKRSVRCLYGAYLVAVAGNHEEAAAAAGRSAGLKVYLDNTHGSLFVRDLALLNAHFRTWPSTKVIVLHAEDISLAMALGLAATYHQKVHIAHVTQASEIAMIKAAKEAGLPVTCEVTPHHLLLTEHDVDELGPYGYMKPELKPAADVQALWENLDVIDCIACDHAPHTREEKESDDPPPGVPGLETTIPLMLNAVHESRLPLERLVEMVSVNPRRIFGLPMPRETYALIEQGEPYPFSAENLHTKVGWSPFEGHPVVGKVREVYLRGQVVYQYGQPQPLVRHDMVLYG